MCNNNILLIIFTNEIVKSNQFYIIVGVLIGLQKVSLLEAQDT